MVHSLLTLFEGLVVGFDVGLFDGFLEYYIVIYIRRQSYNKTAMEDDTYKLTLGVGLRVGLPEGAGEG